MGGELDNESALNEAIDRLVDEYRTRCLWFLREDFYPKSREERIRASASRAVMVGDGLSY